MDIFTLEGIKSAGMRALHAFAQTAIGMMTVGQAIGEVNWLNILSVSAVAAVISLLKSIVVGTPETKTDGVMTITDNPDGTAYQFEFNDIDPSKLKNGSYIRLNVEENTAKPVE